MCGGDEDEDEDIGAAPVDVVEDEPANIVPEDENTCEQELVVPTCDRCKDGEKAEEEEETAAAEGPPTDEVASGLCLHCEEDEGGEALDDEEANPDEVEVGVLPSTPAIAPTSRS